MSATHPGRLLIVGNPSEIHVGSHLAKAARMLGIEVDMLDMTQAFAAPRVVRSLWWRWDRRPFRLRTFSRAVVEQCRTFQPTWLLTTGLAPVDEAALQEIGRMGIARLNYLTDDPWNPAHRARWFFRAVLHYDHVFSPRQANLEDLRRLGCREVTYLPFAYNPTLHFPEPPCTVEEKARFACDVVFAGGADRDRVPYIAALIRAGFNVGLYGGYWERYPETRAHARGHVDMPTLRKAIGGAKVALCLVRRANRDGHVMRTFEVPAMKACMLTEDTQEHREIFGPEGEAVLYFRTPDEMITKLRWLLDHDDERRRLAAAARARIINGRNTYKDRLMTMLELADNRRQTPDGQRPTTVYGGAP